MPNHQDYLPVQSSGFWVTWNQVPSQYGCISRLDNCMCCHVYAVHPCDETNDRLGFSTSSSLQDMVLLYTEMKATNLLTWYLHRTNEAMLCSQSCSLLVPEHLIVQVIDTTKHLSPGQGWTIIFWFLVRGKHWKFRTTKLGGMALKIYRQFGSPETSNIDAQKALLAIIWGLITKTP